LKTAERIQAAGRLRKLLEMGKTLIKPAKIIDIAVSVVITAVQLHPEIRSAANNAVC